jgi:hypothetical protein
LAGVDWKQDNQHLREGWRVCSNSLKKRLARLRGQLTSQIKRNFIGKCGCLLSIEKKQCTNHFCSVDRTELYKIVHKKDKEKLLSMKDLLDMRENYNGFKKIVQRFLKEAVGKRYYYERLGVDLVSTIATCSDEAFVYLTLENNFDLWSEIAEHQ